MLTLVTGSFAITISNLEMTIKVNQITFPGTQLTDSRQLIALLIGIPTLFAMVISAFMALFKNF
jgi:hypothetical protein